MLSNQYIIVGYSGHAHVVCDSIREAGGELIGYLDKSQATSNPFSLDYLGSESDFVNKADKNNILFALGIGDNQIRYNVATYLKSQQCLIGTVIHPSAYLSKSVDLAYGVFVNAKAVVVLS